MKVNPRQANEYLERGSNFVNVCFPRSRVWRGWIEPADDKASSKFGAVFKNQQLVRVDERKVRNGNNTWWPGFKASVQNKW
eukprot:3028636-Amphidinium_carterae.1